MKKLLFCLLTILTASLAARADVLINSTNFPDAGFRAYLMEEYPSGRITTAQLNSRNSLILDNKGISDLTGIGYFVGLKRLYCRNNYLSSIDLKDNTRLVFLNLDHNYLTSIDLSKNDLLEEVYLQENLLRSLYVDDHNSLNKLWVGNNSELETLYCGRNALTYLDITNCTALKSFKCNSNTALSNVIGLRTCTALTSIDCKDCAFTDLSAVEYMPNLASLDAANNNLTSLDISGHSRLSNLGLSGNTQLTTLSCNECALTNLAVGGCTALTRLECYGNPNLGAITDLADCTGLTYLNCNDCNITDLSAVRGMGNITSINANNNNLGIMNVAYKPQLINLQVSGNPNMTEIRCYYDGLTTLKVDGCTALEKLDCDGNGSLSEIIGIRSCSSLIKLSLRGCSIPAIDVSGFTKLELLDCGRNVVTSINVNGCTALKTLYCDNNPYFTAINSVFGCTSLTYLVCDSCPITSVEGIERLVNLERLYLCGTQLTSFSFIPSDSSTPLSSNCVFFLTDNMLLKEIKVHNTKCTGIVPRNCPALEVLECSDNSLDYLDLTECPSLKQLDCKNNVINSLKIYGCSQLKTVICNDNKLVILTLEGCSSLEVLWCQNNSLYWLDFSSCSDVLYSLDCRNNQLTTLDVSNCSKLYQLACSDNLLESLDLSNHTRLINLWCKSNKLTSLDVSGCTALQTITAYLNQLPSLNVNGCSSLQQLEIYANHINAFNMGKIVSALPTRSNSNKGVLRALVDPITNSQTIETNEITVGQVNQANAKFWDVYHYNWDISAWELYTGGGNLPGDVDGDGNVSIADVTALIDYLLNGDASAINLDNADLDGSGDVSIADVTALIDFLLSGSTSKVMKPVTEPLASSFMDCFISGKEIVLERLPETKQ